MLGGLGRIVVCLILFAWGVEALGGGVVGWVGSGLVSLLLNHIWHEQQREGK